MNYQQRQPAAACRHVWYVLGLLMLSLLAVSCQPVAPQATPTATRTPILPTATATPIPTSTPTATPTVTPTPTPTLPPGLVLAGEAAPTDLCPVSPADLTFLRDGALWVCASEGGAPQLLLDGAETASDVGAGDKRDLSRYEISADRRFVTAINNAGQVSVLDRVVGRPMHVPTAGRLLDANGTFVSLVDAGSSLIYLGWGVQTDPGPALSGDGSGVIFSASAISPTLRQQPLAACVGEDDRPCNGFLVSPDETRLAVADGRGVWLIDRAADAATEAGPPLARRPAEPLTLVSWSPDGRWLLLSSQDIADASSAPAFVLLSADAQEAQMAFLPLCSAPCNASAVWARASEGARLWLVWETTAEGCVASVDTADLAPGSAASVVPDNRICEAQSVVLRPSSPIAGPAAVGLGGVIAFLQDAGANVAAGVYALDGQAALRGVALLPERPDRLLWSVAGDAFLTLDAAGSALQLGLPRVPALWDVQALLTGAGSFVLSDVSQE